MSKSIIYYFSGTGNSFAVARDVAGKINADLIPVTSVTDQEIITTDADIIGIVFPVYDFKHPPIIEKFVGKLTGIGSKYLFAVCTYGIKPLSAMKIFDKLIQAHGGKLSAGFAVEMPHNGIGSGLFSEARKDQMIRNWKVKLNRVCSIVLAKEKGRLETSNAFTGLILSGLIFRMMPTLFNLMRHVVFKGWDSLALTANANCDGCGICEKICPVNNITMNGKKPSWSKHCAGCMACLHWCPKEAIQLGVAGMNIRNYHHPEVKLADMMKQRHLISQ